MTGLHLYWQGEYETADEQFQVAMNTEPGSAEYAYFHALALYEAGLKSEADQALLAAVELERDAPISGWGTLMQRVQGEARLWLETTRQQLTRD
jgi:tetratricopeptide (TPR) repeat protein